MHDLPHETLARWTSAIGLDPHRAAGFPSTLLHALGNLREHFGCVFLHILVLLRLRAEEVKVSETLLKTQDIGETAHALAAGLAQWPEPGGVNVGVTNGDARRRGLMRATSYEFVERRCRFLHAGHGILRIDARVKITQPVGDFGCARRVFRKRQHQSTQEIPGLRVSPGRFVHHDQLRALKPTRLGLAPSRLQLRVIPPKGRDPQRKIARAFDEQVDFLAAPRARRPEKREVAVRIKSLKRHAITPKCAFTAAGKPQRHCVAAHLRWNSPLQSEPRRRPDWSPA